METTVAAPAREGVQTSGRVRAPRPAPITVTENAAKRIADIIARAPEAAIGVRLTTPKRGCSGLAYSLAYLTEALPGDERIDTPGGTLFVDGGSLMYLIGSVMDWQEDDFTAGFVFANPNAKGQCGCGESFTV
jgi:iron-sulfur cluster assembly protein